MNNKINFLKWSHFKKYLTSQPYYVWNNLEQQESNDDFDIFSDLFVNLFEKIDAEDEEQNNEDFKKVILSSNSFGKIKDKIIDEVLKLNKNKKIYQVISKSIPEAVLETKKAYESNEFDLILFPVFEYKEAVSSPLLFDIKDQKISNMNFSSSTKIANYIKAFWDYYIVLKALKIESKEIKSTKTKPRLKYTIYCLKKFEDIKKYKKGEIHITETRYIWNTKTAKNSINIKLSPEQIAEMYKDKRAKTSISSEEVLSYTIENILENLEIPDKFFVPEDKKKTKYMFEDIDYIIDKIKKYKTATLESFLTKEDSTVFGTNVFFNEIIKNNLPDIAKFSKKIIGTKDIIAYANYVQNDKNSKKNFLNFLASEFNENEKNFANYDKFLKFFKKNFIEINKDWIPQDLTLDNEKVIWYDFEGFSMPIAAYDYIEPYQQIVFQVSIIETNQGDIVYKNNYVYDPQELNYKNFIEIINNIYANKVNKYVVFNKTYENSRLKEMIEIIKIYDFNLAIEMNKKVQYIIDHTIDLAVYFTANSINKLEDIKIFISNLYGKYSIKIIENYITSNPEIQKNLKYKITPYKELVIKNGIYAMEEGMKRYFNEIGDNEWKNQSVVNLAKYCENDVMAMLMVYEFIKYCIKNYSNT